MPGALFARERIKARWLQHRYTRIPRGPAPDPAAPDSWGGFDALMDPDPGAPASIPNLPCLYLPAGTYALGPLGPITTDRPTLIVAYDDALQPGDRVEHVVDAQTNYEYKAAAAVENMIPSGHAGPPIYLSFNLLDAEVA